MTERHEDFDKNSAEERLVKALKDRAGNDPAEAKERVWSRLSNDLSDVKRTNSSLAASSNISWAARLAPAAAVALFLMVTVSSIVALPRPGAGPASRESELNAVDDRMNELPAIGSEKALAERIVANELRHVSPKKLLSSGRQRDSHPLDASSLLDSLDYVPGGSSRLTSVHRLGTAFTLGDDAALGYEYPLPSRSGPQKSFGGAADTAKQFSRTHLQEQGVDEADSYKTDGNFIYRVNERVVQIIKARPLAEMRTVAVIDIGHLGLQPQELYLHEGRMTVIATGQGPGEYSPVLPPPKPEDEDTDGDPAGADSQGDPQLRSFEETSPGGLAQRLRDIQYYPRPDPKNLGYTAVLIYDVTTTHRPRLLRRLGITGDYTSSRRVGAKLYLINSNRLHIPYPMGSMSPEDRTAQIRAHLPQLGIRDSSSGADGRVKGPGRHRAIDAGEIRTLDSPGGRSSDEYGGRELVTVSSIDLFASRDLPSVNAFWASSRLIYSTAEHLYFASTGYSEDKGPNVGIFRFDMTPRGLRYSRTTTVPGEIHNRFSMDEHSGYLRIFTTGPKVPEASSADLSSKKSGTSRRKLLRTPGPTLDAWWSRPQENRLTILDSEFTKVGGISGIAPGERIQSARCGGGRCYLVTFRVTDPFFVIDVANPRKPKMRGELKVPGFSTNLYLLGDEEVLGIGVGSVNLHGDEVALGVRAALYDVSNPARPKVRSSVQIGDDWSTRIDGFGVDASKSLLIAPEAGVIGIPVRSHLSQRVELIRISKSRSLELIGSAGNMPLGESARIPSASGHTEQIPRPHRWRGHENRWEGELDVSRMLYIDRDLYTLSEWQIRAYGLADLRLKAILDSPSIAYISKGGKERERADHRGARPYLPPKNSACSKVDGSGRPYHPVSDVVVAREVLGYRILPSRNVKAGAITAICVSTGDSEASGDAQVIYSTGVRMHVKRTAAVLDIEQMVATDARIWQQRRDPETQSPPSMLRVNGVRAYAQSPGSPTDDESGRFTPGVLHWQVGGLRYSLVGRAGKEANSLRDLLDMARSRNEQ